MKFRSTVLALVAAVSLATQACADSPVNNLGNLDLAITSAVAGNVSGAVADAKGVAIWSSSGHRFWDPLTDGGGGGGGGAVTNAGTFAVQVTNTPTFNFGTLNGAATAANQSSVITSLGLSSALCAGYASLCAIDDRLAAIEKQLEDTTLVSIVKFSQTSTDNNVQVSASALPSGAATSAAQTTANTSLATLATNSATQATAANQTSANTKLDTLHADMAASIPAGAAVIGYVTSPFDVQTTITRPANVTAYTGGDVVGGALDLGVLGLSAGSIEITGLQLEGDIAAIPTGQTSWVLHLYSVTPPSALADNAVFDVPSGDRASYLGSIAFATLADLGSTLYVEANNLNKRVKLAGTHLFGYLVTVGGFTPAANSEVYKVSLHTVAR